MSVTQYLDLAYAVSVEDRVRRGATLVEALDATKEWAARSDTGETVQATTASGNTYQSSDRVDPGGPGAPVSQREIQEAKAVSAFMSRLGKVEGIK
jgi:hypothetical protein